jgi:hypothetical protein
MRLWILISSTFVLSGLALFLYKVLALDYPVIIAEGQNIWRMQLAVEVTGEHGWTTVEAPLPRSMSSQRVLSEEVRGGPFGFKVGEEGGNRYGRWTAQLDGSTVVSYQATVVTEGHTQPLRARAKPEDYPEEVATFIQTSPGIQTDDPVFRELSAELLLDKRDEVQLARDIYRFVAWEVGGSLRGGPTDASSVATQGRGSPLGRARLFCALARVNGVPCRVVMGLSLASRAPDEPSFWNDLYVGGQWVPFDVVERRAEGLPPDRLMLSTRDHMPVRVSGASAVSHRFFVQSESEAYEDLLRRRLSESSHRLDRLSILFLPVQVQQNLRLLLLVPLGALVMTLLRNVVGLRTFGMFMPMLIALALTATGLLLGSTVFVLIIGFALLSRLLIRQFYLLLVARVAFILTLIVLLMVAFILAGDRAGISLGGTAAFPLVIMTMIVERISVSLEEEGFANTLRRIGGTLVAIYVTYGFVHVRTLQMLFIVFPELAVSILGLLIAVGRYTGYRVSELVRFRSLAVSSPSPPLPGGGAGPRGSQVP